MRRIIGTAVAEIDVQINDAVGGVGNFNKPGTAQQLCSLQKRLFQKAAHTDQRGRNCLVGRCCGTQGNITVVNQLGRNGAGRILHLVNQTSLHTD